MLLMLKLSCLLLLPEFMCGFHLQIYNLSQNVQEDDLQQLQVRSMAKIKFTSLYFLHITKLCIFLLFIMGFQVLCTFSFINSSFKSEMGCAEL